MDTQKFIDDFIEESKKEIAKEKQEDNYCIILYKTKMRVGAFGDESFVHKVYKNLDELVQKGVKDIDEISSSFGVRIQNWYFD